jgi:serine/threonine-protein kinase
VASQAALPVREGDLIAGKYRVERVLGAGGMGVVAAATHVDLAQRVAVKFLLREACGDGVAVARFLREARAAVRIQSEHVARVTDVGTLPDGAPYMVMEYLVGSDLAQLVQANGAVPLEEAVEYVLQACEAVAEAHALGIVHRDLKPSNLFLARRADGTPLVKVLDFGISKARVLELDGREAASMTATSAMMGSPLYMSPEQMRSAKNVDARTDVWSLGVILYELLTGKPVYEAETLPGLCAMIASDPVPPLRARRSEIPPGLEEVVLRCLEKDVARRWQSVAELAAALAPWAPKRARLSVERVVRVARGAGMSAPQLAPSVPPPKHEAPHAQAATAGAFGTTVRQRSARRRWIAAGAAILIVAGAIAASLLARRRDTRASVPATVMVAATGMGTGTGAGAGTGDLVPAGSSSAPAALAAEPAASTAPLPASSPARPAAARTKGGPRPAPVPAKGGKSVDPLAEQ